MGDEFTQERSLMLFYLLNNLALFVNLIASITVKANVVDFLDTTNFKGLDFHKTKKLHVKIFF